MEKPVVDFSKLPEEVLEEYEIEVYSSYEDVFWSLFLDDQDFTIDDAVELLKNDTMQEVVESQPYMYKFGDKYYRWTEFGYMQELAEKYPGALYMAPDEDLPWNEMDQSPKTVFRGNYAEIKQQILDAYRSDDVDAATLLADVGTNLSLSQAFELYADLRQEIDGDKTFYFQSSGEIYDVAAPDLITPEEFLSRTSDVIPDKTPYEHLCEFIANEVPLRMALNDIEVSDEDMAKLIRVMQGNTAIMFDHEGFNKFLIEKHREIAGLKLPRDNSWHEYSLSREDCDKVVDAMVSTIRGIGVENGSGYYGLKAFEIDGEKINLYCEITEHLEEDGYDIYYAVEFDEGDTLFYDWAHTHTKDRDELKNVVFEIASTDVSKDVREALGSRQQQANEISPVMDKDSADIDRAKVARLGLALSDMRHEINGAAEFAPDLLPLKEKQYAILDIKHDAALNGVDIDLSPDKIIDLDHLDCFWYDGYIGSLSYKGYTVSIEAHGDVSIGVLSEDLSESIAAFKNPSASDVYPHFKNDKELVALAESGRLVWQNNNWLEFVVFDKDGNEVDVPMADNVLDNDVLDAFSDVGYYKQLIDEIDQKISLEAKSEKIAENPTAFVFDEEIIINDDHESVNAYLWAVDSLVDRLPSSESMDNINFYADYNVRTGGIELVGSYYTHVNGEEVQKTMALPLSDDEKTSLVALLEAYSSVEYNQSCLEIVNEARASEGKPLIEPVGYKTPLSAQINSAENAKQSVGEQAKKSEIAFDDSLNNR